MVSKVDTVVEVIQKTDRGSTKTKDFATNVESGCMPERESRARQARQQA